LVEERARRLFILFLGVALILVGGSSRRVCFSLKTSRTNVMGSLVFRLELDEKSCSYARSNVDTNNLNDRIRVVNANCAEDRILSVLEMCPDIPCVLGFSFSLSRSLSYVS
jgi:hypothetical protein